MSKELKKFQANCTFWVDGSRNLHGATTVKLPDGRVARITTGPGIHLPTLTFKIAKQMGVGKDSVGWGLGDVWDKAKKAAGNVGKSALTGQLAKQVMTIAENPLMKGALNAGTGGQFSTALALGKKAATLIDSAKAGNPAAKRQIAAVRVKAAQGDPSAKKAEKVLQAVNATAKAKRGAVKARRARGGNGVSLRDHRGGGNSYYATGLGKNRGPSIAGWAYNRPYRPINPLGFDKSNPFALSRLFYNTGKG